MRALLTPYAATCDAARLEEGARAVEISLRAKHHLMLFLRLPLNRVHSLAKGRACLHREPSRVTRRGVAQPGRALSSGGRGRRFESSLPDHFSEITLVLASQARARLLLAARLLTCRDGSQCLETG